ncbi:hypothetical protein IIA28_12560 [candidate division KSB1 bacterium]|nr:hypothetical protein [candidate division KSB1 bacterium]
MRIQTGNPVRGKEFFNREKLIEQAWDLIEAGNHILLAAPRRVGKTSVMYYLMDNPKDGYTIIYLITQSVNNENEFFRRIVTDRFKPVYYALMYFMQKEYPNEYRKMGGELKQTVEEVLQKIQQLAKDYD